MQKLTGFKYTVHLDQAGAVALDLDIDWIDLGLLDILMEIKNFTHTPRQQNGQQVAFKYDWEKVIKRAPLCGLKSRSGVKNRIQKLVQRGLLEYVEMHGQEAWIAFTPLFDKMKNFEIEASTKSDTQEVKRPPNRTVSVHESGRSVSKMVDDYNDNILLDYTSMRTQSEKNEISKNETPETTLPTFHNLLKPEWLKLKPKAVWTSEDDQSANSLKYSILELIKAKQYQEGWTGRKITDQAIFEMFKATYKKADGFWQGKDLSTWARNFQKIYNQEPTRKSDDGPRIADLLKTYRK